MIKKQSQTEKQTIRERQMETQRTRIRDRAEKKHRERRTRISRFRIIKSERGENIKQRSRVLRECKRKRGKRKG